MLVHDFDTAAAFLHTRGKPVPRKKLSNNTYLVRESEDVIHVQLHRTYIVTYRPDTITLNTGGWLTVTTKARVNDHLPFPWRVSSVKGTWHLQRVGSDESYRFTDGITVVQTFTPIYEHTWTYPGVKHTWWKADARTLLPDEDSHRQDRHNAMIRKQIGTYLKAYRDSTLEDGVSCTLCMPDLSVPRVMSTGREPIPSYGDTMGDTQHLLDHMLDGVLPMHLVSLALRAKGYLDHDNHGDSTVTRVLRAYLSSRLMVGATAPVHGRHPLPVSA